MGVSRKGRKPTDLRGLAIPDLVMARLESGLPLKDALMPGASYEGWHSHCKLHQEWAERAKALVKRNAEAGKLLKLQKMGVLAKRQKTHCLRGHELTPENTRWKSYNGYTTRMCKTCQSLRGRETGPSLPPKKIEIAIAAFNRNVRFGTLRKLIKDISALYRTIRRVPELQEAHHRWALGGGRRRGEATKRSAQQKRYAELVSMLPTGMPMKVKADIIGAIYEAHGNRKYRGKPFGITKAKTHIKEFIADYRRTNPKEAYGDIKTPWSLDAPIYDDGPATLADRATRSIWDEAPL